MKGESGLFRTTIFALSSGTLPSGVAVVRMSGPQTREGLHRLVDQVPPARYAVLRKISDGNGRVLDRGLVLFFEGPHSFTGEDSAELHLHGGRAVVAALLATLAGFPDFHLAEAGEFTRRAFLNGKLDLTGAEALADLIAAETESQRRLALGNAEGGQKSLYTAWARRLLHARAMIEAEFDFADEGDIPGSVSDRVWTDMEELSAQIAGHLAGFRAAEIIRDGFRVVLAGAPNAGKSSLINTLARRDVAIVTEIPGTTRDLVEVTLDLDGVKIIVTDTAGLRVTDDPVEKIGVSRALEAARKADLILHLTDLADPADDIMVPEAGAVTLQVGTKSDLAFAPKTARHDLVISTTSGDGIASLIETISSYARAATDTGGNTIPSRFRHVDLLRQCATQLGNALNEQLDLELRAEELRLAASALERITGATDVEDLLGLIFSEFCVGK